MVKRSSAHYTYRRILVNGFGAKVGGLKGRQREWGSWEGAASPSPAARGMRCAVSSPGGARVKLRAPAAKLFSRILNTHDDLSGQQDD